jgi:hypothetical protein
LFGGFAGMIGKKFKSEWRSFKDYLLLDRAIPFHMPHPKEQPYLVTRAIAMSAGWMWQIPLIERVGAGYVFSSKRITARAIIMHPQKIPNPIPKSAIGLVKIINIFLRHNPIRIGEHKSKLTQLLQHLPNRRGLKRFNKARRQAQRHHIALPNLFKMPGFK